MDVAVWILTFFLWIMAVSAMRGRSPLRRFPTLWRSGLVATVVTALFHHYKPWR